MGKVEVSIAIATPSDQREIDWIAAEGATIRDIVEDGVKKGVVPKELRGAAVGVWGERKALDYVVRTGDRIEFYRPLSLTLKRRVVPGQKRTSSQRYQPCFLTECSHLQI